MTKRNFPFIRKLLNHWPRDSRDWSFFTSAKSLSQEATFSSKIIENANEWLEIIWVKCAGVHRGKLSSRKRRIVRKQNTRKCIAAQPQNCMVQRVYQANRESNWASVPAAFTPASLQHSFNRVSFPHHNTHSTFSCNVLWIFFHFHLNSIYILYFSIQAYILILDFPFISFRVLICATIHIVIF